MFFKKNQSFSQDILGKLILKELLLVKPIKKFQIFNIHSLASIDLYGEQLNICGKIYVFTLY